jgi:branched-subunit amino acid aminotransferase/4-amino-4-deoxychorismate lyase
MAWVAEGLVPLSEARVSVLDLGFRTGEGVFETIRTYGGIPFRLPHHLVRAAHGAERLGFEPPSTATIVAAVEATVAANAGIHAGGDTVVRLTMTPGQLDPDTEWPMRRVGTPTLVITSHLLVLPPELHDRGVDAITVPWGREAPDVKAVSYLAASLARRQAHAAGADEALLTDPAGRVLEGSASNVFAVLDGHVVTPPVEAGLLPGVTRAAVIEVARHEGLDVVEEPLPRDMLLAADEAFLTASTREVVALIEVDGQPIGGATPGPVTQRLLAAYRALVRAETAPR